MADPDGKRFEFEEEEAEAARRDAAAIGGTAGDEGLDPAQRPLVEAGQGESEGFELAEHDLVKHATLGGEDGNPLDDAPPAEAEEAPDPEVFGEADHEHSSEN